MKKTNISSIILVTLIAIFITSSAYAVPMTINYQGKLTDPNGSALNGEYQMSFSLFNTNTNGTTLWSEQQIIMVADGIYNVQLGAVNPLSADIFDNDALFLEVGIESETLSPRQRLTSVAFAIRARQSTYRVGSDAGGDDGWYDDGVADVTEFGATPNGGASDGVAIQNAIDAMKAKGGGKVWFPPGTYDVTGTDNIVIDSSGITLAGSGVEVTVIDCSPSSGANKPCLSIKGASGAQVDYVVVRDLTLNSKGATGDPDSTDGIEVEWARWLTIQRVRVARFHSHGIELVQQVYNARQAVTKLKLCNKLKFQEAA